MDLKNIHTLLFTKIYTTYFISAIFSSIINMYLDMSKANKLEKVTK